MIGQTFTLISNPKLVFRLVWRGSIGGIDCVRGVALNGKFQTLRRATDVVFVDDVRAASERIESFSIPESVLF